MSNSYCKSWNIVKGFSNTICLKYIKIFNNCFECSILIFCKLSCITEFTFPNSLIIFISYCKCKIFLIMLCYRTWNSFNNLNRTYILYINVLDCNIGSFISLNIEGFGRSSILLFSTVNAVCYGFCKTGNIIESLCYLISSVNIKVRNQNWLIWSVSL